LHRVNLDWQVWKEPAQLLVELLRLVLRFFGRQEVQPLRKLAADARTLVNEVALRVAQLDFKVVLHPAQRWHHAAG